MGSLSPKPRIDREWEKSLDRKWEKSHVRSEMTPTELIRRSKAYCAAHNVALSTLSRKILGSGKELKMIESGQRNLGFDTMTAAFDRLDALELAKARGVDGKEAA
jgi:hypothetical protein